MTRWRTLQVVVSVGVVIGALAWLLTTVLKQEDGAMEYFHQADIVMARAGELKGQRIRMGGHVDKGSIHQKPGTLEYFFRVRPSVGDLKYPEYRDKTIDVLYTGVVPDTFKDDATVIVTGMLADNGVFQGKDLTAKCPSKYEAAEKQMAQAGVVSDQKLNNGMKDPDAFKGPDGRSGFAGSEGAN